MIGGTIQMNDFKLFERVEELDIDSEEELTSVERYLTFLSDNIAFGVSTNYVIEIIANYAIREVPNVPSYVKGVINLRGQVLPVIDVRLRMNKPFKEYNNNTCIIILEIDTVLIGLIVDSVLQVQDIDTSVASPIPIENGGDLTNAMLSLPDGTVVLLLDCDAVIKTV